MQIFTENIQRSKFRKNQKLTERKV